MISLLHCSLFNHKHEIVWKTPSLVITESRTFSNNMKMPDRPSGIDSFDRTTLEKFNKKQDRSSDTSGAARNLKGEGA